MADSHESRTIGVPLQNSLVSHGFYLDNCIDLIEGFHALHSFPCVELETRATDADKGPFLAILEGGLLMKMALHFMKFMFTFIKLMKV